jgi:hypothetical protein
MLYFQRRPDPLLTLIVERALGEADGLLRALEDDEDPCSWAEWFPSVAGVLSRSRAREQIHALRKANADLERTYRITDHHWLIVHECLKFYSRLYNDRAVDCLIVFGGTTIRKIDLDGILGIFFWNEDFAVPSAKTRGVAEELWSACGLADDARGARSSKPAPDPEDLRIIEETDLWHYDDPEGERDGRGGGPVFRPGCEVYPAPA